ncbi:MAG TPA: tetratricopeptide repeat protein, partial [Candidatus Eisenbacteria bacterium]|nr:tetratricopeptide repeat protein [Candidatus Eisenbacteria bacterium]
RAFASAGQLDSAAAAARRAIAAQPDSLAPRRLLARALSDAGHDAEAARAWEDVRARAPGDPGVLLDLGLAREKSGDVDGAVQAGRDALRLAPGWPTALNYLGYLLADHDRDLEEARALIARAVAVEPDNGAFLDSLGWVYFRLGRLAEARTELERALVLTGGDPVIHEHLGDVYKQLRLTDLAREQYKLSLAGDGGNARVKQKLADLR